MEAAKAAATAATAAQAAAPATAVATVQQSSMAMTAPAAPAAKLNMETVSQGTMTVDLWLKPKEYGIQVGEVAKLVTAPFKAVIDMTDGVGFTVKKGIKAGNPAKYWYTTDGATCTQGGSWEAAVAKAKGIDQKAYEYRCADLPFTLLDDVKTGDGTLVGEKGKTAGYTTSTTNWKNWELFYKECAKAGLLNEKVVVEIFFERRENAANNAWGVLTFKLLGSAEDGE
jgi:hypothetical protein